MRPLQIEVFPCRSDNFGVLLHDPESHLTASIDAPEEAPIVAAAERNGWKITHIFTTHHHTDHIDGVLALKERYGATVIGPRAERETIPGLDFAVVDGAAGGA